MFTTSNETAKDKGASGTRKPFITKEGKLFGKVSVIDVFVLLAIVVLAFGIYARVISPARRIATTPYEIEYQVRVHGIRHSSLVALQNTVLQEPAGEISDFRTGEELGAIVGMTFEQAYWDAARHDGSFERLPVPDRFDAIVTIRVDGRVSDTGYFTHQNRRMAVGSNVGFRSRYVETSGEIISIQRISEVVEASESEEI